MATSRRQRQQVDAMEEIEQQQGGFDSTKLLIPDGVNLLTLDGERTLWDILPYEVTDSPHANAGDVKWVRQYYVHRRIGSAGDDYVCLKKELKQPCPVCEYVSKLAQTPGIEKDTVNAFRPKQRQLFNVYDYNKPDDGFLVFELSYHLFGKMLNNKVSGADPDDPLEARYRLFASPDEGMTVKTAWSEESFQGNKYYEASSIEFRERTEQWDYDEVLDGTHDLDRLPLITPYEELKAILHDDDGVPDDSVPRRRSSTSVAADISEDDPPAPARKKKVVKKKVAKTKPAAAAEEEADDAPAPAKKKVVKKKGVKKKALAASAAESDESEEAPAPAKKKTVKKKVVKKKVVKKKAPPAPVEEEVEYEEPEEEAVEYETDDEPAETEEEAVEYEESGVDDETWEWADE